MDLFEYAEQAGCTVNAPSPRVPCRQPASELPDEVLAIISILSTRRGIANAITAPAIAASCGIQPHSPAAARGTYVRALIARHLLDIPFTVVASSPGYYRPETRDDVEHYRRDLHSRARKILCRLRDLKVQARAEGLL